MIVDVNKDHDVLEQVGEICLRDMANYLVANFPDILRCR